jgi:hypothetical protein
MPFTLYYISIKNIFILVITMFAMQTVCNATQAARALLRSVPQQVSEQVALSLGPIFNHVSNFIVF